MTKTLLIVDDEDDIREVAEMSIELGTSWAVVTASSGATGVARAAETKPDAILLDVMMPGMDGPATLAALKGNDATQAIPIIFLTAKVRASDRETLVALGATAVLSKPFDPLELPQQIADALGWGLS
ncbi:MAG: response regulator [Gemmatimonadaceae bacterium]